MSEADTGDLFDDPAPPAEPAVDTEASAEVVGSETGEEVQAPPAEDESQSQQVPLGALKEERRKRQELERQVQQLSSRFEQSTAPQQPAPPKLDFLDDPEGFVGKEVQGVRGEMQRMRMDISEAMTRRAHPDYDEKLASFRDAIKGSPHLVDQMRASADPGGFAYETGKQFEETRELGSISEWKTKQRELIKAELLEEMKKQGALAVAGTVPKSNAGARAAGTVAATGNGDSLWDEILA